MTIQLNLMSSGYSEQFDELNFPNAKIKQTTGIKPNSLKMENKCEMRERGQMNKIKSVLEVEQITNYFPEHFPGANSDYFY